MPQQHPLDREEKKAALLSAVERIRDVVLRHSLEAEAQPPRPMMHQSRCIGRRSSILAACSKSLAMCRWSPRSLPVNCGAGPNPHPNLIPANSGFALKMNGKGWGNGRLRVGTHPRPIKPNNHRSRFLMWKR